MSNSVVGENQSLGVRKENSDTKYTMAQSAYKGKIWMVIKYTAAIECCQGCGIYNYYHVFGVVCLHRSFLVPSHC